MQGPGGRRRPSLVGQGPGVSSGSQRRASIASGIFANKAMSSRRQSTTSDSKALDTGSLLGNQYEIRVFDDEGKDVTPHPLFHSDPKDVVPRQGKLLSSASCGTTGPGFLSSFSMHQAAKVSASSGLFSRTCGSRSTSISNISTTESMQDEIAELGSQQDPAVSLSDVQVRQEEIKEELTKEELDRRVDIYLTETETLWMLDMPSVVVSVESEDAGRVLERNRIYTDICKNRPGNDRFVEKIMQTINGATKNKEVQCDKIIMEDKGLLVTSWDLYDSFNIQEKETVSKAEGSRPTDGKSSTSHTTKERDQTMSVSSNRGSTTPVTISEGAVLARIHKEEECHSEAILTSKNFHLNLFFMERILMENIFQPKLAAYRQFPVLIDPDVTSDTSDKVAAMKEANEEGQDKKKEDKEEQKEAFIDPSVLSDLKKTLEETAPPRLEQLWSYMCDLTHGHSVSSMAWNKVNPDLLAVGYRAFDFKEQKKGLACCWSLKNPMWPERIFRCKDGVTALDFSMASPNLLAVGMYNGSVAIYDVRNYDNTPLLESSASSNKHTGPIWQLKWVEQDRSATGGGKKERLICISADSRVTEWLIQKRLDCTNLMKIKRTGSEKKKLPGEKGGKREAPISQQAAGMCFDFHPKDTNVYLAGTEEGHIHKCSCSCNEQFLQTYRGHKGPVYKVTWNPFSTDMFLSCSADWSIILWQQDSQTPILTFSSTTASVNDIMWSPKSASIFAAANKSRVEIWDLSVSIFHPVVFCFASPGAEFTSVLFANNTDCLLAGDSKGEVGVFELQNLAAHSSNKVDNLHDTIRTAVAVNSS
ncbi:dynein axonemal intermediate chain 4 isoform X2 [Cuculus canorus]|uniref:dynein axonemal intermediate chain 4 isoform X2 n=1 Tax=Cuculus canorus TaxID=55661 RepID=UPI0023AACCC5|nr:dynein axonemal intermediate chain 4 isoform X2 [Cuculus canorus]